MFKLLKCMQEGFYYQLYQTRFDVEENAEDILYILG